MLNNGSFKKMSDEVGETWDADFKRLEDWIDEHPSQSIRNRRFHFRKTQTN